MVGSKHPQISMWRLAGPWIPAGVINWTRLTSKPRAPANSATFCAVAEALCVCLCGQGYLYTHLFNIDSLSCAKSILWLCTVEVKWLQAGLQFQRIKPPGPGVEGNLET